VFDVLEGLTTHDFGHPVGQVFQTSKSVWRVLVGVLVGSDRRRSWNWRSRDGVCFLRWSQFGEAYWTAIGEVRTPFQGWAYEVVVVLFKGVVVSIGAVVEGPF
jgi:hypothetical protein